MQTDSESNAIKERKGKEINKEKFPSTLLYTGSQSDEEKNKAVHDFQKCKKCDIRFENHVNCDHEHVPSNNKIIALSTKAGGVGLTLTAASRIAVIELPWHPADCEQIESRFHRKIGRASCRERVFRAV